MPSHPTVTAACHHLHDRASCLRMCICVMLHLQQVEPLNHMAVHWINELENKALFIKEFTKEFPKRHTADNISDYLHQACAE